MNNFLPKLKKPWAYARILLEFLQANPELEVAWADFFKGWKFPFLWQYPTARLSELKEMWLVEIVWKRENKLKNIRNIFEYKITKKWLKYNLS